MLSKKSMALQHGVPLVPSYNLDATLSQVIDLVVGRAIDAVPTNDDKTTTTSSITQAEEEVTHER